MSDWETEQQSEWGRNISWTIAVANIQGDHARWALFSSFSLPLFKQVKWWFQQHKNSQITKGTRNKSQQISLFVSFDTNEMTTKCNNKCVHYSFFLSLLFFACLCTWVAIGPNNVFFLFALSQFVTLDNRNRSQVDPRRGKRKNKKCVCVCECQNEYPIEKFSWERGEKKWVWWLGQSKFP